MSTLNRKIFKNIRNPIIAKTHLHEYPSQPKQGPAAHSPAIGRKLKGLITKEKREDNLSPLPLFVIEYSSLEALYKLTEP